MKWFRKIWNSQRPSPLRRISVTQCHQSSGRRRGSRGYGRCNRNGFKTGVDIIALFKNASLGTLCLDECHHLRNEWWKSLKPSVNPFADINVISLTATPPYEGEPALWERYGHVGKLMKKLPSQNSLKRAVCVRTRTMCISLSQRRKKRNNSISFLRRREHFEKSSSDSMFVRRWELIQALDGTISKMNSWWAEVSLGNTDFPTYKGIEFQTFPTITGGEPLPTFDLAWFEISYKECYSTCRCIGMIYLKKTVKNWSMSWRNRSD